MCNCASYSALTTQWGKTCRQWYFLDFGEHKRCRKCQDDMSLFRKCKKYVCKQLSKLMILILNILSVKNVCSLMEAKKLSCGLFKVVISELYVTLVWFVVSLCPYFFFVLPDCCPAPNGFWTSIANYYLGLNNIAIENIPVTKNWSFGVWRCTVATYDVADD